MTTFNAEEHLTKVSGRKYLEVKWRIAWFRDQCPHGTIQTEMLHLDLEKGIAIFKATVSDGVGGSATGHGSETSKDFADFVEKAETKSVGRALAQLGYGTQFALELDEQHRIVDSPVAPSHTQQNGREAPRNREKVALDIDPTKARLNALWSQGKARALFGTVEEMAVYAARILAREIEPKHLKTLTNDDLLRIEYAIKSEEDTSGTAA